PHLVGSVRIVGQGLRISQEQELLVGLLKSQTVEQRSGIVANVQRTGGAVACQNNGSGHEVSSLDEGNTAWGDHQNKGRPCGGPRCNETSGRPVRRPATKA